MNSPDLLATIVAAARRSAEYRRQRTPPAGLEAAIRRPPRGHAFAARLRDAAPPRVIAECKRRSPSRGILRGRYEPAAHAAGYERAGAAAVSVLTEPAFFDGALEHLAEVRAAVAIPILRKDFVVTEYQILESAAFGADAVLLIAGALAGRELSDLRNQAARLGLAALVEVHDREELRHALDAGAEIVGVNSRNLRTLAVDPAVLDDLIGDIPASVLAVAESGLRSPEDLSRLSRAGYHAFLIGERLIGAPDPGQALEEMLSRAAC